MAIFDKQQAVNNDGENRTNQESFPPGLTDPLRSQKLLNVPDSGLNQNNDNTVEPRPSQLIISETKDVKEDKPAFLEDLDLEHDVAWTNDFRWLSIFLIIFGRWPITYSREPQKRGYIFKFSWKCPGFLTFFVTVIFTVYGLVVSSINVIDILMDDKLREVGTKTKTQIIEQSLAERHTMILIIMLGSYGINTWTLFFIFAKRHEISETFTKWTRFLYFSKLSGRSRKPYVKIVVGNYVIVLCVYVTLTLFRTSATLIGGPTVIAMIFTRQFLPKNYLEKNFIGSSRHRLMHAGGLIIYIYVVTACNIYMYLFLWLLKSIENAFFCWNTRMNAVIEASTPAKVVEEDIKPQQPTSLPPHPRLTYQALYHDHIGLVRMLSWLNNMFAFTFEPYVLFVIIKIVYQMYLAALVMKSNGKPLNQASVGKYFIRKGDYVPPVLLTYENSVMLLTFFLACSWLEDTAYDSYDVLRKYCLLNGTNTDKQSFFFLSMFQSYTSTTKMAVYGGQYFCVDRYTILHVLSAIMSNFLVVYQFEPLFDMDTVNQEYLRNVAGKFLKSFEGLPANHTLPVPDSYRNRVGF